MTVVTVTLNAAVDKTYIIPDFTLDRVHRPSQVYTTAGGKGINVARVYHTLGGDVLATGFLGGANGDFLASKLSEESIPSAFVRIKQQSRLAIAVLDPKGRTQTEINEAGPLVSHAELAALTRKITHLLAGARWMVLSGSIPPGVPADFYARLIHAARRKRIRTVLDTSGEPLAAAITERPTLVKPNRLELDALGIGLADWKDAPQAARQLRARYDVDWALVTGGDKGAVLASAAGAWRAEPPNIEVVSAVGSGDSLAAAVVWSLEREPEDNAAALAWGVAAGAANAALAGAGFCTKEQIEEILGKIRIERVADGQAAKA